MVLIARFPVLFSNILLLASAGTLIKVVYLVRENKSCMTGCSEDAIECSTLDGILHFVKFETKYLNEWIEFLHSERIFFGRSISLPFSFIITFLTFCCLMIEFRSKQVFLSLCRFLAYMLLNAYWPNA